MCSLSCTQYPHCPFTVLPSHFHVELLSERILPHEVIQELSRVLWLVWLSWLEHHPVEKGLRFDSPSGHTLRLQVRFLVGMCVRRQTIDVSLSHQCFFLSLSFSLLSPPLFLSLSESNRKKNILRWGFFKKELNRKIYVETIEDYWVFPVAYSMLIHIPSTFTRVLLLQKDSSHDSLLLRQKFLYQPAPMVEAPCCSWSPASCS